MCDPGFALVGDMIRTCMDDNQADIVGVWSGSTPTCEGKHFNAFVDFLIVCLKSVVSRTLYSTTAIECPSLNLPNGTIAYTADTTPEFKIGTEATHMCDTGFALFGDMSRTCMDDDQEDIVGMWSGSAPTCARTE